MTEVPTSRKTSPNEIAHGALRGVIAAQAMTGLRAFTISGLVDDETPRRSRD